MIINEDLDVIIPVMNRVEFTRQLFADIAVNTVMPHKIYVIDNGSTDETAEFLSFAEKTFPLKVVRNEENIGVNASWNMGVLLSDRPFVSILNNDISIPFMFFEKVVEIFYKHDAVGLVLSRRAQSREEVCNTFYNTCTPLEIRTGGLRCYSTELQGWAFSVRRELISDNPIPSELKTFCGDLHWFLTVEKKGYHRAVMLDVPVWHYIGGISMESMHDPVKAAESAKDHEIWERLQNDS